MPRTVLVVDDDEINRQVLHKILHSEYTVLDAKNGQEAVLLLEEQYESISAVLLDIVMPVMDGFGVLERKRENPALSRIPVIVTTVDTGGDAEKRALALGANDFVAKPFDADILKRRLDNLIKLQETAAMVNTLQKDPLTGIWNRETFFQKAAAQIEHHAAGHFFLSALDIDGFKIINDQYGTQKGDEVLIRLAAVLEEDCEKSGGLCGRIAADNFALLFPRKNLMEGEYTRLDHAMDVLHKMDVPVNLSVGRYIVKDKSLPVDAMYDRAKIAQGTVKGRYDAHFAVYNESMREGILRQQEIVDEMKSALEKGEFEVWLQPQYNHSTGALIGAEALVRWRHPKRGIVSPAEFIPVFEKNGFVYELDKFVWETCCQYLQKWLAAGRNPLPISVNISRYDLFCDDLIGVILSLMRKYEIPEDLLRLEVTESAFARSAEQVVRTVKEFISHGFTVEIDDFGSGYSSLNTLKDVPAQILKLDMRFLEAGGDNDRGGNILESIVRMAKWIGMAVIAEGVEKKEQADFLESIGCSYVQGYLYARPMPVEEYEALAPTVVKEERLLTMETVKNLDNNAFWNPESMDTLIFNTYVGAACIFEYQEGRIELLRSTEKFAQMVSFGTMTVADTLKLDWHAHLDEESRRLVADAVRQSSDTLEEVTCEIVFVGLPGCPEKTYVRAAFRVIAKAGAVSLVYNIIENTTAKWEAQRKEREVMSQLSAIMQNVNAGISAMTIDSAGEPHHLFTNDRYYELFGYTREQYESELGSSFDPIHPDDLEGVRAHIKVLVKTKKPSEFRFRCYKHDGSLIVVRVNASLISLEGVSDTVILAVSTDITDACAAEQKMMETDEQLRFLNEVSSDLLAQPEIEVGIYNVLYKIVDHFGADRATIMELDHQKQLANCTYEACAWSKKSALKKLQGVPHAAYDPWLPVFAENGYVRVDDVLALLQDHTGEHRLFDAQRVKSIIAAPLHRDGKLVGCICLDNPTRRREQAESLCALGDYFAVMLNRRDLMAKIENDTKTLQTLMDDTPGGFVRMRIRQDGIPSTEYVNESFCRMRGLSAEEILKADRENAFVAIHPDDKEPAIAVMKEVLESGEKRRAVYRLLRADGSYVPLNAFGSVTKNEAGETFINIYYTELSAQEAKEYSMREAMPFILSAIMDSSPNLDFAKDKEFRYICCSPPFARFAGQTKPSEVIGKTDFELFDEQTAQQFRNDDEKLFASGESLVAYTEPIPSDDGTQHYSVTSKYILRDAQNNIVGLYGTGRDVTDTRDAFDKLKLLTDSIPGGIASYAVSPEGVKLLYYNEGFHNLSGCTREEYEALTRENVFCKVFAEDAHRLKEQIAALVRDGTPLDCTFRTHMPKNGGYKWLNLRGTVQSRRGDVAFVNTVAYDVTAAKNLETSLKLSTQLVNDAPAAIYVCDAETYELIYLNEQCTRMCGKPLEEAIEKPCYAYLKGQDKPCEPCYMDFYSDTEYTQRLYSSPATGKHYLTRGKFINWGGRRALVQYMTDETEHAEAQLRLEASHRAMEMASRNAGISFWHFDLDKRVISAGETQLSAVMGYASERTNIPDDMVEKGEVHPEDVMEFLRMYDELFAGAEETECTVRLLNHVTGKFIWYHIAYMRLHDPLYTTRHAIGFSQDVERQQEIQHRADLDPLTGVYNRSAFAALADRLRASSGKYALLMLDVDDFKLLNDSFGHAAGDQALVAMAEDLRALLQPQDLLGRLGGDEFVIALAGVTSEDRVAKKAKEIGRTLRKAYSADVQMSVSIGVAVCPKDGGGFESLYHKADAALYAVKNAGKDSYAFFRPGMAEANFLAGRQAEESAAEKPREPGQNKKRMLIVEDNALNADLLANIFEEDYHIDRAKDGAGALVTLKHYGTAVSVVLLDLMMPVMSGYEVLEKMRADKQMQGIPVIVVSGTDDREAGLRAIRCGANDFVSKPVDPALIRVRVQSAVSKAENERLRAQNSFLSLQKEEVDKYRRALDSSHTAVVEYDRGKDSFVYDAAVSRHIAGSFDDRALWRVLLSDKVASAKDVEAMRTLVDDIAEDQTKESESLDVTLQTPAGEKRRFTMRVHRLSSEPSLADKLLLTFTDREA